MKRLIISFSLLLCFCIVSNAQSITPFTVNIAGFTGQQNGYSLTVSTGETISITDFKTANGASLSSGFLQNNPPIVTGINEVLSKINADEVVITPNPTNSFTNLVSNFSSAGKLQYQVLDINSKLLFRSQPINGLNKLQTKIELSTFPPGTYYIQVFFKSNIGNTKCGIYKIIKL